MKLTDKELIVLDMVIRDTLAKMKSLDTEKSIILQHIRYKLRHVDLNIK